jgi:hypothetical protein
VKHKTLISFLFLYSFSSFAGSAVYTSLNFSGETLFAGVKISEKGEEPDTYLLQVNSQKMSSDKINLPAELIHREVVALLPSAGEDLVVVTQKTTEQGDNPLIHTYRPSLKKWTKVAEAKCMSFAKLEMSEKNLIFHCVETNDQGKEVIRPEKVATTGLKFSSKGALSLPQTKVDSKDLKAELIGESFEWKELKVSAKSQEKIFKP